jgi:hypothetical protein
MTTKATLATETPVTTENPSTAMTSRPATLQPTKVTSTTEAKPHHNSNKFK